jgi:hypothetical protein
VKWYHPTSLLLDLAAYIDRPVWRIRRTDWHRARYVAVPLMGVEQWLNYFHDGWRPARYI